MPAKTGSRNGLSYGWALGENNWNTGMDGNLTFIDRFGVHLSFKSFLNTPPGSPAAGDCHVIGTVPTGVWVGKAGQVAVYDDGAWRYGVPRIGWQAYCEAEERQYVYDGGWTPTASEWAAATVDQAEAEAGTDTTRRAWTAQRVRQAIAAWWLTASSAFGRTLVNVVDAAAGRAALGLGTIATQNAASVEVGTLSASGQIYSAANIAAVGFEISDYAHGGGNGVFTGNADGASATGANLKIRSWYGIGFGPNISGQAVPQDENAIWMDVRNGTLTGRSWAMFDRFFNADGSAGDGQANAKNHFTQSNSGAAGIAPGWLSAAFGKADGGRLAFGQYGGKSYLVGHNENLNGWDTVNIRSDELHYYVPFGDTPSIRMGGAGIDSLGSIKASASSIGVQLMAGEAARAFHLATLPASTMGTYDHLRIVGSSGAWESDSKSRFELIIGNRAGLTVRYLEGQLDANRNISLHPLANGDVEVYAVLMNFSTMDLQMYGCGCTVNQPVVERSASTAATWSAAGAYPRRQSRYDTERELITVNVDSTGGQELWNRSNGGSAYVGTRLRNDINGDGGVFRLSSSNTGYAGPNSTMLWSGGGKIAIWNQGGDAIEFATSNVKRMTLDVAGVLAIASLPANDFPNDAAAAADGIPIGGLYHTSGTVRVRLS